MTSGRLRPSNFDTPNGMKRITMETDPRCRNAFDPETVYALCVVGEVLLELLNELPRMIPLSISSASIERNSYEL